VRRLIVGRKRVSIALGLLLTLAMAGGAVAYWTQGGTGSGTAGTGNTVAITVNQTNAAITDLYPGQGPVALSGDFDNPNAGPVYVASVTAVVRAFTSQTDVGKPACTEADFQIAGTASVAAEIPAGNAVGGWSGLTIELLNGAGNQDNCKDVTVTIDYTANP
jgi:hypothetical protein